MKPFSTDSTSPTFVDGWYIDPDICDGLIDFFKEDNYFPRAAGETMSGVNSLLKESVDKPLSNRTADPRINAYLGALQDCLNLYLEKYQFASNVRPFGLLDLMNIQYYPPGGGYKVFHAERNGSPTTTYRHLVFMTYLNDVTDGGGTEWFYQNLTIQPEKGLTVIWPTDWTHTHRGIVSPTQEKFIITGWYDYI